MQLVSESHRSAAIDDQNQSQIGVCFKLFDIVPITAAVRSPIQTPQIVARLIPSILGKFNAGTAMGTLVLTRDRSQHRAAGDKGQRRQSLRKRGVEKGFSDCLGVRSLVHHEEWSKDGVAEK
jgi:hypothetical protein